jgi:SAM-dependent methyltransferase
MRQPAASLHCAVSIFIESGVASMTGKMDVVTGNKSLQRVHELIANRISTKNARIYEAGGGSATSLPLDIFNSAHVTVVDIDEGQLQRNRYAETKILGDIQTQAFSRDSFEIVVCYNVIEHLDAPDEAIAQFYHALVPGGILFIAAPNPESLSGWITKITPHWFHVQFYRLIGYKDAGQPGQVPFPTVFHRVVSPSALIEFCRKIGFNVLYFQKYKGMVYENIAQRRPVLGKLLNIAVHVANALMLWRDDLRNGDYHIVLEKPITIKSHK